ncbi:hypothetical protein ACWDWS_02285 [Streptomyces sp. NPDC003328]
MAVEGTAARWTAREQARVSVEAARVLVREDVYHSESLIITRCTTDRGASYYVVVESDCVFPEDVDALELLGAEIGEPWRMSVLDSEYYMRPHPALPMSALFWVHVVCQVP